MERIADNYSETNYKALAGRGFGREKEFSG